MPNIPARVSFITLAAKDYPSLRKFYQQFGWPESKHSDEGFCAFQTGGAILGLWPMSNYTAYGYEYPRDGFKGFVLAINVETPEKVDEVIAAAKAAGAKDVQDALDADWGGRSGMFTDPEGNVWEVAFAPGTSFDERGGLIFP